MQSTHRTLSPEYWYPFAAVAWSVAVVFEVETSPKPSCSHILGDPLAATLGPIGFATLDWCFLHDHLQLVVSLEFQK